MATQTTYYEFNKPEGTDLVNPLVDTNPNWDALDADLHDFNERSISNASEIVALGVHTISRLDTTAKFLKWIATANYTAGETFTVDGLPVAATTPAGATLATNAYVTGSIVLACLNADNTAMTIFVSGTNVATDAERLGGELPSYYGTASDVADNANDITNLQNQVGNTSIVGIGDGTCTGAIDALNNNLTANSKKYQATFIDGKYGFMIDSVFYEIGGGSMPAFDFTNPVKTFTSNDTYTAVDGDYLYIAFMFGTTAGSAEVRIDGTTVSSFYRQAGSSAFTGAIKLKAGQVVTTNSDFSISKAYIVREA